MTERENEREREKQTHKAKERATERKKESEIQSAREIILAKRAQTHTRTLEIIKIDDTPNTLNQDAG